MKREFYLETIEGTKLAFQLFPLHHENEGYLVLCGEPSHPLEDLGSINRLSFQQ